MRHSCHPSAQERFNNAASALALAQKLQALAVQVLGLLNDDTRFPETISNVVCAIQASIGVDAAAIRLRNGDDFNFFASSGFSSQFLEAENKLTVLTEDGCLCCDDHGQPVLACMCGLVLSGRSRNPSLGCSGSMSCFLNHGEASLVFDPQDRDPHGHLRGRCFREGYQSIAWIPVRARQQIVGLLLLCDQQPNRFCAETITFLEGMSASIGVALTRRQAEEELNSKSARLNLASTLIGMGAWSWVIHDDKRDFDDQTCRLLGISPATFTGSAQEFFDAVHPDDREAVKSALRRTLTTSGAYETEYRAIWKDGTVHYIAARGTCIRDASNDPIRIEGLVWDVTERRVALAALHRNETLLNAIISNISDVVAIIDEAGVNRFKSSNLSKWFGWQPEEVVGKPAAAHVHPEDLNRVREQFAILRTQPGASTSTKCRYLCKDGTYKWIELNAVNLLHDVNIAGVLLNYHDISQRQHALAASRESEQRYRVLFHNTRDALLTVAPPNWQVTECNAAAVALFGFVDASEFNELTPWQMSPEFQPDGSLSREKASTIFETTLRTGSHSFEWVHRNAKGEDFPASVSLVVVELSGSCLVQATVRDESERRRLFAQMAQADRLASMGMLAGGVSHDINNPLAFVRYNLESLAEDLPKLTSAIRRICRAGQAGLGDKEHRALLGDDAPLFEDASLDDIIARQTEALEGVERIISITRALSTFSRVDQGDRTKVDVAVAIEAAVNMAHNEVAHRARLSSAIKPLPFVWASEGKLSHAFLNLIVNAARAIDEGDAPNNLISICAWAEDQAVIVEISDTGKGIDAERLEHVFDPFYTTGSLENGPGLGVSISKSILAEFGGTLNVASKPGMGSRFTVRLPEMKEPRGPTEQRGRAELEPTPGTRARILVIDDEPNILRALTRTLSGEYAVVSVASGRDAQRLISTDSQFDLVLCDLMMSQVSGTELHAWLAKHHPKLAKQVVFITGGAFTPKARDYLASVDNLTLEKPFNAAELRQRVANAVRIGRQQN